MNKPQDTHSCCSCSHDDNRDHNESHEYHHDGGNDHDHDRSHGGGEFDLKKELAPVVLVVV